MLKNKFEARNYLKMLLIGDRNNCVSEAFEMVLGYFPKCAYDIIYNDDFLNYQVEESKEFDEEEWGINKEDLKEVIKTKLANKYL